MARIGRCYHEVKSTNVSINLHSVSIGLIIPICWLSLEVRDMIMRLSTLTSAISVNGRHKTITAHLTPHRVVDPT